MLCWAAVIQRIKIYIFFRFQGFFLETSIVSCCWVSNVLQTHKILLKSFQPFLRKSKLIIFFMWSTLHLTVSLEWKNWNICMGTLDIDFERDWSVGLGTTLGDDHKKNKKNCVSGIFSGKADSVMLLSLECTINPQYLIKIVGAIFEKIEVPNFFLMWTTHNFKGRSKTKTWASNINERILCIEFNNLKIFFVMSIIVIIFIIFLTWIAYSKA